MRDRYGMAVRALIGGVTLMVAGGCESSLPGPHGPSPSAGPHVERITYSVGPCHGTCPVYTVTSESSGEVWFEGERFTKVAGRSPVNDPALFRKLRERLAPLRPAGKERAISSTNCTLYATDQQTVTIRWKDRGAVQTFNFDLGCHDERYLPARRLIEQARQDMPIDGLVGRKTTY